jgi:o-succinylbenzoate synthase
MTRGLAQLRAGVGEDRWPSLVDFIEDPCPFDASHWTSLLSETGIALDREGAGSENPSCWTHRVIKPAVESPGSTCSVAVEAGRRVVVTSYLDHPVGQMHAAASAGRLVRSHADAVDVCGLLSHGAYESTPYTDSIDTCGSRLLPMSGSGVGFDELLEAETWRRLV